MKSAEVGAAFGAMAERYADGVERSAISLRAHAFLLEDLTDRLPAGSRILDLGAGPGTLAIQLAKRGFSVTAADVSTEMLEEAKRRAREADVEIEVQALDATADPPALEPFDAMVSLTGPLTFFEDGEDIIKRMAPLVRPWGQVWLAMPRAAALGQLLRAPRLGLGHLWGRRVKPHQDGPLKIYLRDPVWFAERIRPYLETESIHACGLVLRWPATERLGSLPLLRRLGAFSVLRCRRPPTTECR